MKTKENVVSCYKVVSFSAHEGQFVSACFGGLFSSQPDRYIKYILNQKSVPEFGKIFCFDNLTDAISFVNYVSERLLFGYGENPSKIKRVPDFHDDAERFWKIKKNKKRIPSSIATTMSHHGTIVVDSFTPIREIVI